MPKITLGEARAMKPERTTGVRRLRVSELELDHVARSGAERPVPRPERR